ncbi:MAG: hypothetical protein KC468_32920, partial [Myxococcales bacterium]|nr:hypothetical protein [Myxococcales bacterium]
SQDDAPEPRPSQRSALVDATAQSPSILEGSDLRRVNSGSPYAPPAPPPPDKGLFRSAPGNGKPPADGARSSKLSSALPPMPSSADSGRRPVFAPPKITDSRQPRRPTLASAFAVRQPGEAVPRKNRPREDSGDGNAAR